MSVLTIKHSAFLTLLANLVFPNDLAANDDAMKFEAFEKKPQSIGPFRTNQYPEDARSTVEDLKKKSLEITHINEHAREKSKSIAAPYSVVIRWEGPIRYRFLGDVSDENVAAFVADAKTLTAETGVSIEMSETDANLDILFIEPEIRAGVGNQFEAQVEGGQLEAFRFWYRGDNDTCRSYFQVNNDHAIVRGVILIRTENNGLARQACLQEQLNPTLGP